MSISLATAKNVFAPLFLDFMFKRAFATEKNEQLRSSLINAFLEKYLDAPIKSTKLLQTVQPGKTNKHRGAIFDLHCEDTNGNKFIVEMQLADQEHFISRSLFYASRTIANSAKKGKEYNFDLPRVYSLSFLNFEPDICNINPSIVQHIGLADLEKRGIVFPHLHFAFALLPRFNKPLSDCKTMQDLWLYLFLHLHEFDKIPVKLKNKMFKTLFDTAKIAIFNKDELENYEATMKYWDDHKAIVAFAKKKAAAEGMQQGMQQGVQQGVQQGRQEILDLIDKGYSPAKIKNMYK